MTTDAKTILVVDDDPDVTLQLTMILEPEGYTVHCASSSAEAEEVLMRVRPDLAIIDLMMEMMDSGFVLCHDIKRLYPGTPVMMLTAVKAATGLSFGTGSDEERSWLETDLLADKPLRPEQIRADVRKLLNRAAKTEDA